MNRPLLKILPGVAVVLLSTSCSKDDDNNIAEDNAALVAEQKIERKVFYLKIRNASSLSKMTVEGLDEEGATKALKFDKGDQLIIKFKVVVSASYEKLSEESEDSGSGEPTNNSEWINIDETVTVTTTATYNGEVFEVSTNMSFSGCQYAMVYDCDEAAQKALQAMQDGEEGAASKYDVQLMWGNQSLLSEENGDFKTKGFVGYETPKEMFAAAPRSADQCFTLSQKDNYCFIIIEDNCTKKVEVNNVELEKGAYAGLKCYIVAIDATVKVDDELKAAPNDEKVEPLSSGKLYYVKSTTTK